MLARKLRQLMTVDEFLAWDDGTIYTHQLIDGVPVAMARPSVAHGLVVSNLIRAFANALDRAGRRCAVVPEPSVIPAIRSRTNARVPDVAVTCSPFGLRENKLPEPVLVAEVLSPSNQDETWEAIRNYATIPSMRIILVLDPLDRRIELMSRDEGGPWPPDPLSVPLDAPLDLPALGVALDPAAFYAGVPTA